MTALTPEAVGALVERLDRALAMDAQTASDREWSDLLAVAMDARNALQDHSRDAVIEEALRKIAEGNEPRPVGTSWFPDGRVSKHDKCTHGIWMYETCGNCIAEFALAALEVAQEGHQLKQPAGGESAIDGGRGGVG